MTRKKRLSRQDIIRTQQRFTFVGRAEQLEAFEHNLSHLQIAEDGMDYPEAFLFNVWGQGGVGKTTLLKRFEDIAKRHRAVAALTDEAIDSVPEVMAEFARQLEAQGKHFKQFNERYKVYRQKRKELETDPEAPQGFSAFVGKTAARVGFSLGRQVPGAGAVLEDFVDEKAVVDSAGDWAAYVTRKLKNKDEVQLVNEPIEVLTPLFLEDLGEVLDCQVVLLFDTYERTDEVLEQWLLDIAADRHGGLPINCIWTIAGREQLNPNRWSENAPIPLPIEPFTKEEAKNFLRSKDITNAEVVEKILDLSERLPLMLATLAESASNNPADFAEASGTAVERFLKWVDDPIKRSLAITAALPRNLNKDVIALLVGEEKSEALFGWLKAMPFVRERSDGWAYHDVVRPQMLRYQRKASAEEWKQKHLQLANHYGDRRQQLGLDNVTKYKDSDWQRYTLSQLYHQLCGHPQKELSSALSQFVQALKERRKFAQQWAAVMREAGRDTENSDVKGWGNKLFEGLRAYNEDRYAETITAFTLLLDTKKLETKDRAVVLAWRGEVYRLDLNYDSALDDFNRAIELDHDYEWAIAHRGLTYQLIACYEEAITDFSCAIKLNSEYQWAIGQRGLTYRMMSRIEDALSNFNQAIKLAPKDTWSINERGRTFLEKSDYISTIKEFTTAIEFDPEYKWAIANRGFAYRLMKEYEDALTDFNRAIEIDPEYKWAIAHRGFTYRLMKEYEDALTDFNRAIEIDPEYKWAIANRGLTYQLMEKYEDARSDFNRAIEIDPEYKWAIANRGLTYQLMEKYEDARSDFNRAIEIDPEYKWAIANRGLTYQLMEKYEDARSDFNRAIEIDPEYEWVIISRAEVYEQLGQYREAISDCSRVLEIEAGHISALSMRGLMYLLSKQYEESVEDLTAAILLADNSPCYCCLTLAHLCLGKVEEARADLTRAVQLAKEDYEKDPQEHRNTFNLGLYYLIARKSEQAKVYYKEAIERGAPRSTIVNAIGDLKRLLIIIPDHPYVREMQNVLLRKALRD